MNTDKGITVPIGTVVNGHPIEQYHKQSLRIKELEAKLSPQRKFKVGDKVRIVRSTLRRNGSEGTNFVGATGILTETIVDYCDYCVDMNRPDGEKARVMSADLELIEAAPETPVVPDWIQPGKRVYLFEGYQRKIESIDKELVHFKKGEPVKIHHVLKEYKPFTPPPMPELPDTEFQWKGGGIIKGGVISGLEGWIAMMQASPKNWCGNRLERLLEIQAHREKWGTDD